MRSEYETGPAGSHLGTASTSTNLMNGMCIFILASFSPIPPYYFPYYTIPYYILYLNPTILPPLYDILDTLGWIHSGGDLTERASS